MSGSPGSHDSPCPNRPLPDAASCGCKNDHLGLISCCYPQGLDEPRDPILKHNVFRLKVLLHLFLLLGGMLLTGAAFLHEHYNRIYQVEREFSLDATRHVFKVVETLEQRQLGLRVLQELLGSTPSVEEESFRRVATTLRGMYGDIQTLAWIPHECSIHHTLEPPHPYVIKWVEPDLGLGLHHGLDLNLTPGYREAMNQSEQEHIPVAAPYAHLSQEEGMGAGMPVFLAVFAPSVQPGGMGNHLLGYVMGTLRLQDLLAEIVRTSDERLLITSLRENTPPDQARRLLALWLEPDRERWQPVWWQKLPGPGPQKIRQPLRLFGQEVIIEVASTPVWVERHVSRSHWLILPTGMVLTLLVMLYADSLLSFRVRTEALVRKRTAELEVNRRRLELAQFVMDHAGDLVFWLDEGGRIVYINATACHFLGWTESELTSRAIHELSPEISPARWTELWKEYRPQHPMLLEVTLTDHAGVSHPVEMALNGMECCDTPYAIAVIRDISERQRADRALRESEQKFRTMADFTHDWEYWVDPEGRILYISPSCETITGYPREDFLKDKNLLIRLVHPEDRATFADHLEHFANLAQQGLGITTLRFRIIAREGEVRWVEHSCRPVHSEEGVFLGRRVSNRDVTARVIAVEALRRERDFIRQMVNSLPGILYLVDPQGRLQLWNDELVKVTGLEELELAKRDVLTFFEGEDRQLIAQRIQQIFAEGRATAEAHLVTADGRRIPYLFTGMRIEMEERLLLVGMGLDISEAKRLEESLRESETRSRTLVATLAEGIVVRDTEGRIISCNQAAERMLGEPADRLIGRNLDFPEWRYVSPVGRPLTLEEHPAHATLQDGQPRQDVLIGIDRPEQETTWISVNTQPMMRPGESHPHAVVSSFSDVTHRRRTDDMLACVRRVQFQFLEKQDPDLLFENLLLDVLRLTRSQYGFISSWEQPEDGSPPFQQCLAISNIAWDENSRRYYDEKAPKQMRFSGERGLHMAAVLGGLPVLTPMPGSHPLSKGLPSGHPPLNNFMGVPLILGEKLVGQIGLANRPEGFHEELLEFLEPVFTASAQIIERHRERQRRQQAEEEVLRLNRELEDRVEERTEELRHSHDQLLLEVEQRRRTETALRLAHQHLEQQREEITTILDSVPAMIFYKDDQNRMIRVNEGFCRHSGIPREKIEGRSLFEVMENKELADQYWRDDLEVIHSGQPKLGIIEELVTDSQRWYQTDKIPYRDSQGRVVGVIGFAVEITARLEAERLRQESIRIEAASRAKSEFLANVSHEIRTPMNSIIGMTDLLVETPLEEVQRRYVQTIQSAGEALLSIINDVLDMSKIESGRLDLDITPFPLRQTVEDACLIIAPRVAQKRLRLETIIAPDLSPWWRGDSVRIRQILLNLLSNAVKFTERGTITLEITPQAPPTEGAPPRLHFMVADTGIGISSEQQKAVFERFMQSDPSITRRFGGTGLGLAICRRLVEMMGGEIWVESNLGSGSRFFFTLVLEPCAEPAPEIIPSLDRDPVTDGEVHPMRILVVDDAEENRMLLNVYLSRTSHHVTFAEHGQQAVEMFCAHPFDLVFMDMQMPVMDGVEATRRIRAWEQEEHRHPATIIALTADAMKVHVQRSLEAGCTAHLNKPIRKDLFLREVTRWERHASTPPHKTPP